MIRHRPTYKAAATYSRAKRNHWALYGDLALHLKPSPLNRAQYHIIDLVPPHDSRLATTAKPGMSPFNLRPLPNLKGVLLDGTAAPLPKIQLNNTSDCS